MKSIKKIFAAVAKKQHTEFGLVAVLVAAFLALYLKQNIYVIVIFVLSLVTLLAPILFYPFTVFWFGLSKILNAISSRILLALVFFIIVTPIGFVRRKTGADSMRIKQFKKGRQSVMITRDHQYVPGDLIHTF